MAYKRELYDYYQGGGAAGGIPITSVYDPNNQPSQLLNPTPTTQFTPGIGTPQPGTTPNLYDMGNQGIKGQSLGEAKAGLKTPAPKGKGPKGVKGAKALGVGQAVATGAQVAGQATSGNLNRYGHTSFGSKLGQNVGGYASTGASIGSFFGPVGGLVGLGLGAVVGAVKTGAEEIAEGNVEKSMDYNRAVQSDALSATQEQSDIYNSRYVDMYGQKGGRHPSMGSNSYSVPHRDEPVTQNAMSQVPVSRYSSGGHGVGTQFASANPSVGDRWPHSVDRDRFIIDPHNAAQYKQDTKELTGMDVATSSIEGGTKTNNPNAMINPNEIDAPNDPRRNMDRYAEDSDYLPTAYASTGVSGQNIAYPGYGMPATTPPPYYTSDAYQKEKAGIGLVTDAIEGATNLYMLGHNLKQGAPQLPSAPQVTAPKLAMDTKGFEKEGKRAIDTRYASTMKAGFERGMGSTFAPAAQAEAVKAEVDVATKVHDMKERIASANMASEVDANNKNAALKYQRDAQQMAANQATEAARQQAIHGNLTNLFDIMKSDNLAAKRYYTKLDKESESRSELERKYPTSGEGLTPEQIRENERKQLEMQYLSPKERRKFMNDSQV